MEPSRCILALRTFVFLTGFWVTCGFGQPPWSGTIFVFPEAFNDSDATSLLDVTYAGQVTRNVYDRRVGWVTMDSLYQFEVTFSDGAHPWEILVNPEFGQSRAQELAGKYSFNIGQMPLCVRASNSGAVIHDGSFPWGGGNPLTIHHLQGLDYEENGILTETLIHEATHAAFDSIYYNSDWSEAAQADGEFISTYARDNPTREDHAETFLAWLVARHKKERLPEATYHSIINTVPNRMEFYDDQNFELSPVVEPAKISFEPNPNSSPFHVTYNSELSILTLHNTSENSTQVSLKILDLKGSVVTTLSDAFLNMYSERYSWDIKRENENLPAGKYIYHLIAEDFHRMGSFSLPKTY